MKEYVSFVEGMHCASCEIIIEKKVLEIEGVKSVEASTSKGEVVIEYEGEKPSIENLNRIFKKENYIFSDQPQSNGKAGKKEIPTIIVTSLLLIAGFFLLQKLGLSGLISVNSKSSFLMFFGLGIMAGISSCAALVGGLILSMSKQWLELYSEKDSFIGKFQPHLIFNVGRVISYVVFGGILGIIGNKLEISFGFTSFLTVAVSVIMIFLGFQMLGVKAFRRFQFTMPRFITRYVANENNFKGRFMPFLMGAATFFLPCGFTITAQGLALISGSPIKGALIMLFFALGTLPMLLAIGVSSVKFSEKANWSSKFLKVAGVLVLFFALFNINAQLNVWGFSSLSDWGTKSIQYSDNSENGLAPIVNGKQVIKMEASSSGYKPNYFKIRAGVPVRWEITNTGASGCTNAVISRSLFDGEINLIPGQTSVKEFTPTEPGKYKFSCWMGMVSGVIEVVSKNGSAENSGVGLNGQIINNDVIPSGAKGCCGR